MSNAAAQAADERHAYPFTFVTLERRTAPRQLGS